MADSTVSASDWIKGISLSILASVIGGASKLAIRKSWLLQQHEHDYESSNIALYSASPPQRLSENTALRYRSSSSNISYDAQTDEIPSQYQARRIDYLAYTLRGAGMIGMTFLNPICCILAMNYASPSVLAPLSGLTLVWIVLFAPCIGEIPSRLQVIAASLIIVGEVIVGVFGDHTNDSGVTVDDVKRSYREISFQIFFVFMTLWMILLAYWMRYSKSAVVKRFAWGVSGGSITGFQNFLKDALTVLKATKTESTSAHTALLFWFVLLAIVTAFGGLILLTATMKRYDATYSAAMFVGSFVVSASVMSAIHYNTFQHLQDVLNLVLYPMGIIILMIGVFLLVEEAKGSSERFEEDENIVLDSERSNRVDGSVSLVSCVDNVLTRPYHFV